MSEAPARVLGVDLGTRRIGLALSDPTGTIASPHSVVQRGRARIDDHRAILAVARAEAVGTVVVGLPLSLTGRDGPAAVSARAEIAELAELAERDATLDGIAVVAYDERLTTVTAERSLREAGLRRDQRRAVVDKVAAAVMLQAYLDGRRAS